MYECEGRSTIAYRVVARVGHVDDMYNTENQYFWSLVSYDIIYATRPYTLHSHILDAPFYSPLPHTLHPTYSTLPYTLHSHILYTPTYPTLPYPLHSHIPYIPHSLHSHILYTPISSTLPYSPPSPICLSYTSSTPPDP